MAKQAGIVLFTGKLENQVGYHRNGKYFIRTVPQKVQQTLATRQSAREFGIASRNAKLIRQAIGPLLDMTPDNTCVNRLNKALISAGKIRLQEIRGFRFNKHTAVSQFFCVQPQPMPGGIWHIPAQQLLSRGNATHLHITAIAVRISFMHQRVLSSIARTLIVDLNEPFNGAELAINLRGSGTLLHILQVTTSLNQSALASRRYNAADIMLVVPAISRPRKSAKTICGTALPVQVHIPSA